MYISHFLLLLVLILSLPASLSINSTLSPYLPLY